MSKARDRRSKFETFRTLRKSGKTAFDEYEVAEDNALYEEVDENKYKTIVRERLNQDDFVVDDNGEGYADDGREEWDRAHVYESDSGDDGLVRGTSRKSSKKAREEDQADRDAKDRRINEYFTKSAANAQPKSKVIKTEGEDIFLSNLLAEMEPNIPPVLPRMPPKKRPAEQRRVRDLSPGVYDTKQPAAKRVRIADMRAPAATAADAADGSFADNDEFLPPIHHNDVVLPSDDVPMSDPMPSSPTVRVASRKVQSVQPTALVEKEAKEDDDEEDDLMMEVAHAGAVNIASVNMASARPIKKVLKAPEPRSLPVHVSPTRTPAPAPDTTDAVDTSAWTNLNQNLNLVSSPQASMPMGKMNHTDAVEEDGSLKFFWTDYAEINNTLCLFGKILDKKTKKHVSCFVKIDNIMRKLYVLPRETRVVDGSVTDESVGMGDVYSEIDSLMTKMGVKEHKTKPCTRKYAFELPNIPKEGRYLKLLYPYTKPALTETSGETFSHVFGATTALFEQFVLWKNIMGPCWLKIEDANLTSLKNASHCKLEVLAEHPNMVSVIHENDAPDAPPLTLLSLAMRMVYHPGTKKQELLAISGRVYENVGLGDTTPADKLPCRTFTVIRPKESAFPVGFETLVGDKSRHRGFIRTARNEAELLSFFLGQVTLVDPDVIVGHQLEGVDYSVLLDRLRTHKTPQWSRIGRFRRQQWPGTINRVGGNVFAERQILSGRLLCDLANDFGRSVMLKCQSWTLTEMCSLYLGGEQNQRREVDCDAALDTWAKSASGLLDFVAHIEADTYFIAALALKAQILPLTKVLTNLAGNSWARTLTGTRAERNEYILLHEFHRNKYICPDKQTFRGRGREDDEQGDAGGEGGKKKDKYKGGLVFEPERGLYDKFVLVMDFNSLYPSIIQEYNICFTTVERSALANDSEEEAVPDVPSTQDQGILPRLISGLVSRRRQVKSLMKDKKATAEQLATWDIKQLALKLTANSMYGCLGYTKSRFYARPLAVLVTYKGREILRSTKELAEEKSLQVIYGDTDSVMINANVNDIASALQVGQMFKKLVNDRYKLLEIDIDNIFRRILLQAKKKYAAINLIEQNGEYIEKMEVKGLDMRRREYCALSKDMSTRILNEILSGNDTEDSITRIHAYLREMADKMRSGDVTPATGIPVSKYIIFTQLGKDPQDYPNADTMPQVQVALREAGRGKKMRKGDVVSYIIATGKDAPLSEPAPKRAYTAGDVMKKENELVPDVEWYISKQIFPPVERLCANISGTSTAQLADNLGLDTSRYAKANHSGGGGGGGGADVANIHPLSTQIPDEVRFADCARLQLRCRQCKTYQLFEGLAAAPPTDEGVCTAKVTSAGIACSQCGAPLSTLSIVAQVDHAVRLAVARYQEAWLVCDDSSCGQRTRQMGVYGSRCMGPKGLARDCLGRMRFEFPERDMYNQLVYFSTLFDVDKAKAAVKATAPAAGAGAGAGASAGADASKTTPEMDRELVLALAEHNRARFGTVKRAVEQYLDKCGYAVVNMDTLFGKMTAAPTVSVFAPRRIF